MAATRITQAAHVAGSAREEIRHLTCAWTLRRDRTGAKAWTLRRTAGPLTVSRSLPLTGLLTRPRPGIHVLRRRLLLPRLLPVPRPLQLLLPLPGPVGLRSVVATLALLAARRVTFTTPVPAALIAHLGPDPFRTPATSAGPV